MNTGRESGQIVVFSYISGDTEQASNLAKVKLSVISLARLYGRIGNRARIPNIHIPAPTKSL